MIVKRIYFLFYTYLFSLSFAIAQKDNFPVIQSLNERSKIQSFEEFTETNKTLNFNDLQIGNQVTLLDAKYQIKSSSLKGASESLKVYWSRSLESSDSLSVSQLGLANELQGLLYFKQKSLNSSIYYFNKSSALYLKCNNPEKAFYSLNMSSTVCYFNKNYFAALKTAYDALELTEAYPIEQSMIVGLKIDMGNIYMRLEQYEKTDSLLSFTLQSRKEFLSRSQLADIQNNLGLCSLKTGKAQAALSHLKEAEIIYKSINHTKNLSRVYNNLASFYTDLQLDEVKALDYYQKAIALKNTNADSSGLSYAYYNIASLFNTVKILDSAIHYGFLAESYNSFDDKHLSDIYHLLSKTYKKKNNLLFAYNYANKRAALLAKTLETSLLDAEKLTEDKHNTYLQHKEIELLEKDRQLNSIRLNRNKNLLFFFGVSFVFLFLLFILYIRTARKQQRINKELFERRISLKSLSSLLKGHEEERKRIAEDLHDGVGNTLTLLNLKANKIKNKDIINLTNQISTEVREISKNIMPDVIVKLGLQEALIDLSEQFAKSDVILDFVFKVGNEIYKDPQNNLMLYRVIQELTKNAVIHGKASYISVHFEKDVGFMNIYFDDNGLGFKNTDKPDGLGLNNIKNRIIYLNGNISFRSSDEGATCHIKLPLHD